MNPLLYVLIKCNVGNVYKIGTPNVISKKKEDVEVTEVDELDETDRGLNGFGSTGK